MANTKSAKKRAKVTAKKRMANKPIATATKTYLKKARVSLMNNEAGTAHAAVNEAATVLDKAAQKGIIHRNTAARRKSRLFKKLNAITTTGLLQR